MKNLYLPATLTLMCALAPLAAAADLQSELLAKEKSFYTSKDAAALGQLLTEDAVEITSKHILNGREAIAKEAASEFCKQSNLELRDAKMRQLAADVVVLIFTTVFDEDCNGKKASTKVAVSSIWQLQNGKWLNSVYHSTPIK